MSANSRNLSDVSSVEMLAMQAEREAERRRENFVDVLKRIAREAAEHLAALEKGVSVEDLGFIHLDSRGRELMEEHAAGKAAASTARVVRKAMADDMKRSAK